MKLARLAVSTDEFLRADAAAWRDVAGIELTMMPTPLRRNSMIVQVSPFMEQSVDHGAIRALEVRGAHNGEFLAFRLTWVSERHATLIDLDEFVDGAAVMFPLAPAASAVTMGAAGQPVNAWYWKANLDGVGFDVLAEGYGTSTRFGGADSQVRTGATHQAGRWQVVIGRPLVAGSGRIEFLPGVATRVAFAVWDGGNRERAGRKSFSGDFLAADLAA